MGRILFFVVLFAAIYFGWRYMRIKQVALEKELKRKEKVPEKSFTGEPMVRCAHCGVHFPKSTAKMRGAEYYCSEEHRSLGAVKH